MKKDRYIFFHQIVGWRDDSKQYAIVLRRGNVQIISLLSLLLLFSCLLLSACAQSARAVTTRQSTNADIYVLTEKTLTSQPAITKLDAQTHQPLWHTQPVLSGATSLIANDHFVVTGNHIYLSLYASFNTKPSRQVVFAFSTTDGKQLWHTEFEAYERPDTAALGWLTTPTADNESVYVASTVGKVYALDASNGLVRWTYDSRMQGIFCPIKGGKGQQICASWSNDDSPIEQLSLVHNIIYGGIKNRIYALDAVKGTLLWSRDLSADQIIDQSITLDRGRAFVVSCNSVARDACSINAYSADTGSPIWHTSRPYYRLEQLTVQNNAIYAVSESNISKFVPGTGVYAWSSTDGKQLWHYEAPKDMLIGSSSPLLVADKLVYVGLLGLDKEARRYISGHLALDAVTGVARWQVPKSYDISDLRAINGQVIYAGSLDVLFAYKSTDGSKLWQYTFSPLTNTNSTLINDIVITQSAS